MGTRTEHHPLPPAIAGKPGPKVMRVRELALPFTGCNRQNRPCTSSPRKHSGAGPDLKALESWPSPSEAAALRRVGPTLD